MLAKYLVKLKGKNRERGIFIVILTSIIITGVALKIILHYSLPKSKKPEQLNKIIDSTASKNTTDTTKIIPIDSIKKINSDSTK